MGIFGRTFKDKSTSKLGDGGKRVTTRYRDGSSEDWNYNRNGRLTGVDCHDSHGRSHSHNAGHGIFGPFKGSKK